MSDKLAELKSKVTNAELLSELDQTQQDLKATQAKLNAPKAVVIASFFTSEGTTQDPILSTYAVPTSGIVTVDLTMLNNTDVNALSGDLAISICDECKYAVEPSGFSNLSGSPQNQRNYSFAHVLAVSRTTKIPVAIIPPSGARQFQIRAEVRCENCTGQLSTLVVNLPQEPLFLNRNP